uniref:Uncharacterized protein n=1 Tax=Paramormyrops kingsleyae TaxID=1676925 RepID=A0A3B3R1Y8_9TELE
MIQYSLICTVYPVMSSTCDIGYNVKCFSFNICLYIFYTAHWLILHSSPQTCTAHWLILHSSPQTCTAHWLIHPQTCICIRTKIQ